MLDLRGRRCVVVGGGTVARRKVEGLLEAGARVDVVAPEVSEMPSGVVVIQRSFLPQDLDGALLAIAATDRPEVNAVVAREAEARGVLVNVVDAPEQCTFILPAVVRRGALQIAVSTGGASPTFARQLRQEFEAQFGPEYGELVELLGALRRAWEAPLRDAGLAQHARRALWESVLALPLLSLLQAGRHEQARALAEAEIRTQLSSV
jgi:precorrin-2 dehydrogenase/sirohydrochlorin ferrochelatase